MSHKNKHDHPHQDAPKEQEKPDATEGAAQPEVGEKKAGQPEVNPLEAELAVMKDRYVRLMADFDNFRKRQLREREEMVKRANEGLLEDLLPFLDTFDIALEKGDKADPFVKGMQMAADQLRGILAGIGMVPVEAAGKAFDANAHEALTHVPSAEAAEGQIISQVRRGWTLNGRLLRAAQVVVSAGAPAADGEAK